MSGQEYFRGWYAENRDRLNESRRERYAKDAEYRQRVKSAHKTYRAKNPRPTIGPVRVIGGEPVPVVRIGQLAKIAGRSVQTIRAWQRDGLLPPCSMPGSHRVFTTAQAKLVCKLADAMAAKLALGSVPVAAEKVAEVVEMIKAEWLC